MVTIDTDVLVLQFAFQRDERQTANKNFLNRVIDTNPATTIYNLMEFLGQMSFNLSAKRLSEWRSWLVDEYNLTVLFPQAHQDQSADSFYRSEIFERAFAKFSREKMAYLDTLILDLAERAPHVEYFVTWNAKHFKNKTTLQVVTPEEFLQL